MQWCTSHPIIHTTGANFSFFFLFFFKNLDCMKENQIPLCNGKKIEKGA